MAYVTVSAEISMTDLDDDDLVREVERRGLSAGPGCVEATGEDGEPIFSKADLGEIEHLHVCGLTEPARALALELVGKAIGRTL